MVKELPKKGEKLRVARIIDQHPNFLKFAERKGLTLSKRGNVADKKALADAGMAVGKVNAALKKHFEQVGATMSKEWADRAGSRGEGVLAAYK